MKNKKKISKKDFKDWNDYINNPTDVYDKDIKKHSPKKKIRYKFDLHGYSLDEASKKVNEIIIYCIENSFEEILLITGKGNHSTTNDVYKSNRLSKLRYSIPEFIKTHNELSKLIKNISVADNKDGGDGALIIKLR